jgi:hypothetical protein
MVGPIALRVEGLERRFDADQCQHALGIDHHVLHQVVGLPAKVGRIGELRSVRREAGDEHIAPRRDRPAIDRDGQRRVRPIVGAGRGRKILGGREAGDDDVVGCVGDDRTGALVTAALPTRQAGVEDRRRTQEGREHHLAAAGVEPRHEGVPGPVDSGRRLVERRLIRAGGGREVRRVGLADDDRCTRRVEREPEPERHVAVGAAEQRRVDQRRARRVDARDERNQRAGAEAASRRSREIIGPGAACHDDVAGSVPGYRQAVHLFPIGAADEGGPLEPRVDYERPARVAVGHVEAIANCIDLPETTVETACGSVGKLFPGRRRCLAQRPGGGLEDERAISIDRHR